MSETINSNPEKPAAGPKMPDADQKADLRRNGKKWGIAQFFTGILVFITVVCVSVTVTLNCRALYRYDCSRLNIPEESGFSLELCLTNYDILIDYNNLGGPDTLEFEEFPMSDGARIHFEEVRQIFIAIEWTAIFGGAASVILAVFFLRKKQTWWMRVGGAAGLAVPLALGLLISADWYDVFIAFHHLMFDNDYWLFDPATDPVILILPDAFFMHCAVMIVALVMAAGAALLILSFTLFRKERSGGEKLSGRAGRTKTAAKI
ncbi:MAG: TIGR01906 family membrane protein [Lachnospiraceae bacterium]|jgi:integral membrane protein (TIGR01906 family)